MIMNAAMAPDSYAAIGWLVVGLASLCVAINQIDDFFERRKTKPGFPPVEQLENSQKALAQRVDGLEAGLADGRREVKEGREALGRRAAGRGAGIYKKGEGVGEGWRASQERGRQ